jgi:hypothetical protein
LPGQGSSQTIRLVGIATEDPTGDGEHDDDVANATDRDSGTYWTTETYGSFRKDGVGLVLDASRAVALSSLTVASDESGFPATIRASSNATGGFTPVSEKQEVGSSTTFQVDTQGKEYRYYEVWLQLPDGGRAHINEVTART